ncbi:MAG: CsgG/HfaB family protein [Bacteriovoracaceae bacterium]|nr:CsgG/HfaB family protein [Bacteroidota bacterium]
MKQQQVLFGLLAICALLVNSVVFVQTAQAGDPKTIAVLYFENNSVVDKDKLDPLKKGLADMMITEMTKIKGIKVVERQRIQSIIEELNLNETDMVDKSTTQKMGKLLGAKVMLFGGFSNLFNDKLRIDVRIVRTETGETLKAEEETGELDEFLTMLQSLVKKIASDLEVKMTSDDEDRLEASKDGNFNGYVTYAEALNFEDQGKKLEKQGKKSEAKSAYENARSMYQKAWDESEGYEPAKQKADEMASLISKLK